MKKPKETGSDIFGDPIPIVPECANCGKKKHNHRATDFACPFGRRDRTGGFSFPFGENVKTYVAKKERDKAKRQKKSSK